ncbi:MAG TPA: phosphohistidine phosphatase SixA [Candidatus Acidoferrales bacterium]|nr:phosphohistidine phosphatase SixA [Candidatus Acidoferrales bacterium]
MELYLVRHGIAVERTDPKCPEEADRFLTKEGISKTRETAEGICSLGVAPSRFLSSPFVRALQTAQIFAEVLGFAKERIQQTEALLPNADPAAIVLELQKLKKARSVFCFGHAPHLDEFLARALDLPAPITALKKSGVACLEWGSGSPAGGRLLWVCPPKILRAIRG